MEILWEFVDREKKKSAVWKKRQRSESSCFQIHAELRGCKDAEKFKIPVSVSVGVFCTALYWLHLKEALSNMFLVAEMEVKEHSLPSFSWSSNTILSCWREQLRVQAVHSPQPGIPYLLHAAYRLPCWKHCFPCEQHVQSRPGPTHFCLVVYCTHQLRLGGGWEQNLLVRIQSKWQIQCSSRAA